MRVKPTRIEQKSAVRVDLPDGMPVMRASMYPDEHPDWLDDLVQRYTPPRPEMEVGR